MELLYIWDRATVEGKVVIFCLLILSIVAWFVMISKALQMRSAKKLNQFHCAHVINHEQPAAVHPQPPVKNAEQFFWLWNSLATYWLSFFADRIWSALLIITNHATMERISRQKMTTLPSTVARSQMYSNSICWTCQQL